MHVDKQTIGFGNLWFVHAISAHWNGPKNKPYASCKFHSTRLCMYLDPFSHTRYLITTSDLWWPLVRHFKTSFLVRSNQLAILSSYSLIACPQDQPADVIKEMCVAAMGILWAHSCSSVEVLSDGVVSLLAGSVPDLKLETLVVHLDLPGFEIDPCRGCKKPTTVYVMLFRPQKSSD